MVSSMDYFTGDPQTNRERMRAGDHYTADDAESGRGAQRAVRLARVGNPALVLREIGVRPCPQH